MTTTSAPHSSCQFINKTFPNLLTPTTSSAGLADEVQQHHNYQQEQKLRECDRDLGQLLPMKRTKREEVLEKPVSNSSNGTSCLKEMISTTNNSKMPPVVIMRYMECRKNHAANIGGYAVDGCREFMPAGEEGTTAAFKCAACSCHRNFHRREADMINEFCRCDCSSISPS